MYSKEVNSQKETEVLLEREVDAGWSKGNTYPNILPFQIWGEKNLGLLLISGLIVG